MNKKSEEAREDQNGEDPKQGNQTTESGLGHRQQNQTMCDSDTETDARDQKNHHSDSAPSHVMLRQN